MKKRWWFTLSVIIVLLIILTISLTGRVVFDFNDPAAEYQFPNSPPGDSSDIRDEATPVEGLDGLGESDLTSGAGTNSSCGNGVCEYSLGENNITCFADCGNVVSSCGNGVCEPELNETEQTCSFDCATPGNSSNSSAQSSSAETTNGNEADTTADLSQDAGSSLELFEEGYYATCTADGNIAFRPGEKPEGHIEPVSAKDCLDSQIVAKSPLFSSGGKTATAAAGTIKAIIDILFGIR